MKNSIEINHRSTSYDDDIVRKFSLATMVWAGVAMLVGILAALQLAYWPFNGGVPWMTFGRIRPLHTNAAIFAFAGNAIFAGIYHSTQRLLRTRMLSDVLSRIHFWGWQFIILCAAVTLPLGFTQGKEYAELEWPIDILVTLVWVVFAINFFGTLVKRREKHMYVAIWFYIATIVTVAVLYIVNAAAIPVSFFKSYTVWAGMQDALVQWWYGHNAVAFFLTTPFLGLMYYYIPKVVNAPIYSYRLSIIHFWALVFIYIWAGPHHLLYTALPDWLQNLGVVFSVMLWAPSWGGMINGLLTFKGRFGLVRSEPIWKFFIAALTFYGMATFEGPLLSIKSVSALGHYTDWIIGHVHGAALGWNGFLIFGMLYYIVPLLWNTKLYSKKLAEQHFWLGLTGIVLYYVSMVVAGITQGTMWKATGADGQLVYPEFIETVTRIIPLYWVRTLGGILYLAGFLVMVYNIIKTIKSNKEPLTDTPISNLTNDNIRDGKPRLIEGYATAFTILALLAILVGTVIEIYPTLNVHKYVNPEITTQPFSALEQEGRDLYVREGCYLCHSQQIRTLVDEKLRYGDPSTIEESIYDHPYQWGSKRTGPDLARVGKKYPDMWHYQHMIDPRQMQPKSIMPNYAWLLKGTIDYSQIKKKLNVLKNLGVPYTAEQVQNADVDAEKQAQGIADELKSQGVQEKIDHKEILAIIAYLQALGQKGGH
ncbi:MAG: cytochrome-c oxidase, cbb3-type subunit I [Bdellovibrionaceae bacterium]|nr:cytochrome-c oxidase, cbb3-type subunit I [Bdellovibrio sp.]